PERRPAASHAGSHAEAPARFGGRRRGVMRLRFDRRALLGTAIGVIAALASGTLGQLSGGATTLIVLVVLAIALVGLGLGAAASLYAYIAASLVMILMNAFPERPTASMAEVAEVIPEPLIVYDGDGRGTYANRAALRLFGRSFIERELAEWGNSTDPRDEQGTALAQAEYPQVAAQTQALRRRMFVRLPM